MIHRKITSRSINWLDDDVKFHREDGPAIEGNDGSTGWFKHGNYHREDGPAHQGCRTGWYLEGVEYSFDSWCKKLNKTAEEQALLKLRYM